MDYSEIIKRLEQHFEFRGDKANKEHHVVERFLLEVSNEKICWWKPWTIFSFLNKLKKAITIIGTIASSCLSEEIDLQKTQLDCLQIQKAFQKQIDELKQKVEKL